MLGFRGLLRENNNRPIFVGTTVFQTSFINSYRMNYYDPSRHHRRSIRLKGHDYSSDCLYFVTFVCQDRVDRFGHIHDKKMILNAAGKLLETEWLALPQRFPMAILHTHQVMPNHFHCILEIKNVYRDGQAVDPKSLGDIIGALQSIVTVKYIQGVKNENWPPFRKRLIQRNFYETIIRSREAYEAITRYIIKNPENPYR
jgi:putative transposase